MSPRFLTSLAALFALAACAPRIGPAMLGRPARPVVLSEARANVARHIVIKIDRETLPDDALLTVWMEPTLSSTARCPNQGAARDFAVRLLVRAEGAAGIGSEQLLLGCVGLPSRRIAWSPLGPQVRQLDLYTTFDRSGNVPGDLRVEWRLEALISGQGANPSNRGVTITETDE